MDTCCTKTSHIGSGSMRTRHPMQEYLHRCCNMHAPGCITINFAPSSNVAEERAYLIKIQSVVLPSIILPLLRYHDEVGLHYSPTGSQTDLGREEVNVCNKHLSDATTCFQQVYYFITKQLPYNSLVEWCLGAERKKSESCHFTC